MKDSEEFYTKTKGGNPSGLLRLFFSMNYAKELKGNIAIDLGAGAGNDALYLAEKGFKVTCIDKEEKSKLIFEPIYIRHGFHECILTLEYKYQDQIIDLNK